MKKRMIFLFSFLCLLWCFALLRASFIQVFPHARLEQLKKRQFQTVISLEGRRGLIQDHNGRELAMSQKAFSLFADPGMIQQKKFTAKKIARELGVPVSVILQKIKDPQKRFVWLQRLLNAEQADKIKSFELPGISFVEEWRRVYPNDHLMSSTLGFVGKEGQALEGIELQYDQQLKGDKKSQTIRRDARGRALVAGGNYFAELPDGHDLQLTIDSEIQFFLENELKAVLKDQDAESALGIVMDANTSAIRAMANIPTFNLNQTGMMDSQSRRNRLVSDNYEPGSTLKTFVLAAGLKDQKITPNQKYFCENGKLEIGKRVIREAANEKFGWMTVSEILAVSSNIGTTKIAWDVGAEKIRAALADFGFGSKIGIDLPGEAKGMLRPLPWTSLDLGTISFGQGISVTPLQITNAYAALVNGGLLNKPKLVEKIIRSDTAAEEYTSVQNIRRVLTAEQSAQIRLMLAGVTAKGGTGTAARVPGYLVGGKTGTAQKPDPKNRGYLKDAYLSSFIGFIPAHEPKFVISIFVDHPKKSYYGAQVAAPIFSKVAAFAARKEGIAPLILAESSGFGEAIQKRPRLNQSGRRNLVSSVENGALAFKTK